MATGRRADDATRNFKGVSAYCAARVTTNNNGIAADILPWWGVSAAVFGIIVPKTDEMPLCLIEFLLLPLAAGAAPRIGQVFKLGW